MDKTWINDNYEENMFNKNHGQNQAMDKTWSIKDIDKTNK